MVMFHSYVSLPEGNPWTQKSGSYRSDETSTAHLPESIAKDYEEEKTRQPWRYSHSQVVLPGNSLFLPLKHHKCSRYFPTKAVAAWISTKLTISKQECKTNHQSHFLNARKKTSSQSGSWWMMYAIPFKHSTPPCRFANRQILPLAWQGVPYNLVMSHQCHFQKKFLKLSKSQRGSSVADPLLLLPYCCDKESTPCHVVAWHEEFLRDFNRVWPG